MLTRVTTGRRAGAGFTLFELILVIGILSVLVAVLVDRTLANLELAEKTAMETQAMSIGSALNLQMAAMISAGRFGELAVLQDQNPFDWLTEKPGNYLGAFDAAPAGTRVEGNWYYDRRLREAVYLVKRGDRFTPDAAGRKRVRYQARPVQAVNAHGATEISGFTFRPVEPYRWLEGG